MSKAQPTKPIRWLSALTLCSVAATLLLVGACNQPEQAASKANEDNTQAQIDDVATATYHPFYATYSGTGTPADLLTEQAYENAYATNDAQVLTQAAPTAAIIGQTQTFIARIPYYLQPTDTPEPMLPTPTLRMGKFGCQSYLGYYAINCWRGVVNGQLISAVVGRLRGDQVGSIAIFYSSMPMEYPSNLPNEIYEVPCSIRSVGIASANGTRLVIVPVDFPNGYATSTPAPTPALLVFDLATRQWVSSTCGPLLEATAMLP